MAAEVTLNIEAVCGAGPVQITEVVGRTTQVQMPPLSGMFEQMAGLNAAAPYHLFLVLPSGLHFR